MKKNLFLTIASGALMIGASGCLEKETPADAGSEAEINPRTALIEALDNQASNLVKGLNKVLIEGKFLQNMALNNPPAPIPMSDDNEVNKAINYLLSNQEKQGNSYSYKPDPKVCTEVMAKNNPAVCIEVMKQISFKQTPANETDGVLEISVGNAKPISILYSSNALAASGTLAEIVKAAGVVDQVFKQNGEQGMENPLPTTYAGAFQVTAASFLSLSSLSFSITSAVDLQGLQQNGDVYSVQIPAAPNFLTVSLESVTAIGTASVALPSVAAEFTAHNDQDEAHLVQISFPGLSGSATLDNSLERISLEAVKLSAPNAYIAVDGQPIAHFSSASQIDAHLQSYAGGDKAVNFASAISAQVEIVANPLMNGNGQINFDIAAGSELFFKFGSEQAKVTSGSFQMIGTGSFLGQMDAQQDSCIEKQDNAPIPLQTVVCQ